MRINEGQTTLYEAVQAHRLSIHKARISMKILHDYKSCLIILLKQIIPVNLE